MASIYKGRAGLQQRVLPVYRARFFDQLAQCCGKGMSAFAGDPRGSEGITTSERLQYAVYSPAGNIHLLSGSYYMCWQRGILSWLRSWDPDVLIAEANPRLLTTGRAAGWMHERGRPVIGWGLGAPPTQGFSSMRRARRMSFLQKFDALIAYSEQGVAEYQALGFPAEKIFIAYNAVSPPPSAPPTRSPYRDQPKVLFVGRLQDRKRVDLLIRACAQCANSPELTVIGDGPARPELEGLAEAVFPATKFTGALHGSDVAPFFEEADLFVLPGTGGLAVQEAMTYALPVIVAEGDGTQNDLVSGNGWLIPPDDLAALTQTLEDALSDPGRLIGFGLRSYELVVNRFNIDAMVETFITAMNSTSGAET